MDDSKNATVNSKNTTLITSFLEQTTKLQDMIREKDWRSLGGFSRKRQFFVGGENKNWAILEWNGVASHAQELVWKKFPSRRMFPLLQKAALNCSLGAYRRLQICENWQNRLRCLVKNPSPSRFLLVFNVKAVSRSLQVFWGPRFRTFFFFR